MCPIIIASILLTAVADDAPGSPFSDPLGQMPTWAEPGRCGANCLYTLARILDHSGRAEGRVGYEQVVHALPAHPGFGNSLAELRAAAKTMGIELEARHLSAPDLVLLPTPFIAHLDQFDAGGSGHFITIYKVVNGKEDWVFLFIDGANGQMNNAGLHDLHDTLSGFVLDLKQA